MFNRIATEAGSSVWAAAVGVRSMISDRLALRLKGRMRFEQYEELDPGPANGIADLDLVAGTERAAMVLVRF